MAKKLTKSKARKILHDKEVHGHPLTEQQRKFFGAIAGGAEPYKAQIGTMLTSLPSNWMDRLSDALAFPQKAVTKLFTGEYQTPSEAMGITNPIGAFATDAILDPFNLFGGAGAARASGAYKNAYKLNPLAFKPNPEAYYRGIGRSGLDDAIQSGLLRTANKTGDYGEDLYMTSDFNVAKGVYSRDRSRWEGDPFGEADDAWKEVLPKDTKSYIAEIPKKVVTDLQNPGGVIFFNRGALPIDNVKLYTEDWLRGYKEVKPPKKKQDGGWLDKYDAPKAQNGIEGTMGGLTDVGFNYNGAWGGPSMQDGGNLIPPMAGANTSVSMAQLGDSVKPIPMQLAMGGSLPGAVGFTYARTQSPAPSNGPYAKKTKASAQDGEEVMKGREYVEQWMNSPMYKQMLEKSAQGPELERISKGRIASLNVPTITSTAFDLSDTNTMGTQKHRIRTMLNATVPEREEMIRVLQTAVDNPKNKEAKRKAQEIMQPTITGWDIGLNPILKPGSHDYESVLAHEHGHTTDAPFIGGDLHKMSLEQLKNAKVNLQKLYIPESDVEKMRKYQEGKVTTDYGKYISRPEETRQFLNQVRYLGKTQGVYDPFTQKITPEQYKQIKPLQITNPMGSLREIYTDEQIIDMLNSISKKQNVSDRVPTAQNGQEMKYYQAGLDFKPKTISQDGSDIPVDPMGYWNPENVGNPVIIPSNIITMEGVDQPLLGISDTGDVQYMEPGEDYEFDGEYVTEYPVAQGGKRVPITVSDPNDPRLKAYQDSLSLHKLGETELRRFFDGDPGESRGKIRSLQDLNKSTKTYSGEIPKNQLYNTDRDAALNSNRNVQKISNIYNRTGILPTEFWANEGFLNYRFKKPVQPVEYRKPEPKQEVVNKPEPVVEKKAPLTDYFQGTPVYAPTPYHGSGAGAFVGYRTPQGDTVFVKPEDYERMGVPKYGREFIESQTKKQRNGGNLPTAQAGTATRADSLEVYNNAVAIRKYYDNLRKKGWYGEPRVENLTGLFLNKDWYKATMDDVKQESLATYRNILSKKNPNSYEFQIFKNVYPNASYNDYLKAVSKSLVETKSGTNDKYYYKDLFPSIIDPMAPSTLVNLKILPNQRITYRVKGYEENDYKVAMEKTPPGGPFTGLYGYDPLSVKPYDMRTPQEKIEWERKYGNKEKPKATSTPPAKKKVVTSTPPPAKKKMVIPTPEPVNKPRPRVEAELPRTVINDVSYDLPTPKKLGPSKLATYPSNTPTKYSFSYPTGKYNEQETIYFPNKETWKSFMKGVKGATTQEGQDYAQATGYLKDGGNINDLDSQPLKKLDQLLNFTNYNKPTKGGWLDKYN